MSEVKSNVSYECKRCGVKGILVENVESINLNEVKKLPCDCPAETVYFKSSISGFIRGKARALRKESRQSGKPGCLSLKYSHIV